MVKIHVAFPRQNNGIQSTETFEFSRVPCVGEELGAIDGKYWVVTRVLHYPNVEGQLVHAHINVK